MIDPAAGDRTLFAFRKNVLVAASAGTGKTHRLTALYVLLALGLTSMGKDDVGRAADAVSPERIVATTFSRAAAREIARRVEAALRALATWDETSPRPFEDALAMREAELGLRLRRTDLNARAARALAGMPRARIDTLHGVARQIVKRFALSLGLASGARVLDEDEAQNLGTAAVDEALGEALGRGGDSAAAARALLAAAAGAVFTRQRLIRFFDRLDEEGLETEELALADHARDAARVRGELLSVARELGSAGSLAFREPARALAAALVEGSNEAPLSDRVPALTIALLTTPMPRTKRAAGAGAGSGERPEADQTFHAFRAGLAGETLEEKALRLLALLREGPLLMHREKALIALLSDTRARFVAAKRRAGGLGFGDLLRGARDALRDSPDIARAVRSRIDALLVDEFQDTSRVQRDLVYLLRERDDARKPGDAPTAARLAPHGLFLVGDRKQSIYGFRGADVGVFSETLGELGGEAARAALSMAASRSTSLDSGRAPLADFVALTENRRSGERILDFVNAFATRDFGGDATDAPRSFEIAYGPGEQLVAAPALRGAGAVVFVADDGTTPSDAPALVREATGVARTAHVAGAMVLRETAEGTRFGDIAVLARRRSTIPFVELALARLGVPYVVAGRALYDAPEVRDLASLVRLLLDPRDRLALATVLRGPMVALSDASLALLSVPGRGLSIELGARRRRSIQGARLEASERAKLDAFRARFAEIQPVALRLPAGEALPLAMQAFSLDRVFAALPRAEARVGNLDRLVSIARRRGGTLAAFARWLDRRIKDDADEAEAAVFSADDDAVRLLTIHASKGLAFPVVVLVDLNAEPRGTGLSFGFFEPTEGAFPEARARVVSPMFFTRHYGKHPVDPAAALTASAPVPIVTSALGAAQAEARAREVAERKRLTYVALTRAERKLALIGTPDRSRAGSAWRTLDIGLTTDAFANQLSVLSARELLEESARVTRAAAEASSRSRSPMSGQVSAEGKGMQRGASSRTAPRRLAVATTPLATFAGCPRRFQLRHLFGFDEPVGLGEASLEIERDDTFLDDADMTPRALGRAAHRVLEMWPRAELGRPTDENAVALRLVALGLDRDRPETARIARSIARFVGGPYAALLVEEDAEIAREDPFVLDAASPAASQPCSLALRGAIDLVAWRKDGRVDVIDYKLARPSSLDAYAMQLRTYALAIATGTPGARVHAGIVFLGGGDEPVWLAGQGAFGALSDDDHARTRAELGVLAERFAGAREGASFDPVPIGRCTELHCGFVPACHGPVKMAPKTAQLGLFDP